MDCRTARNLMPYYRAGVSDLDAADRAALDAHLAGCPECDALVRAERHVDGHLARAMREVPIPVNLRKRLLTQLARSRDEWYRRWLGHGMRVAAVAAVLVLAVSLGLVWRQKALPALDTNELREQAQISPAPPSRDEATAFFAHHDEKVVLPDRFNYSYFTSYGLSPFANRATPTLHFIHKETAATADVYILSAAHFDISAVQEDTNPEDGYHFKVEIWKRNGFIYVIRYSGDLSKLLRSDDRS